MNVGFPFEWYCRRWWTEWKYEKCLFPFLKNDTVSLLPPVYYCIFSMIVLRLYFNWLDNQVADSDLTNAKFSMYISYTTLNYSYCFILKLTYKSINICQYKVPCVRYKCKEGLINIMSKYLRKIPCYEVCSMSALYFVIMSDSQTLHIYLKIHRNKRRSIDNLF